VKSPHSPRRSDCARPLDAPIRRTRASTRKEIVQSYYRALAVDDIRACLQYAMALVAVEDIHLESVLA
jgi:hypothetical protein